MASRGKQGCQVSTERKDQRAHEDLQGSQGSMGSLGSRVKKETEERKGRGVYQDEIVDYLALQGLPDLRDKPFTSRQMTIMTCFGARCLRVDLLVWLLHRADQDSQGQRDRRVREGPRGLQDTPPKDRKESPASSWGPMGPLSTWAAWQDSRVRVDLLDLWDPLVPLALRVRKERSGFRGDRVDLDSTASKV